MAGLFFGIFLMTLAAGRLSETVGGYYAYFGGAAVVSLLVQAMAGWAHNQRLAPDAVREALPDETAGAREN